MQVFKNWFIFVVAVGFWGAFFAFLLILTLIFFPNNAKHSIIYDITEGALQEPSHSLSRVEQGKELFKQCSICHSLNKNQNKIGPSLYKIIGKDIASEKNFLYSNAMLNFATYARNWSMDKLDLYLRNPQQMVPGNRMAFYGISNDSARKALLLYLCQEDNIKK